MWSSIKPPKPEVLHLIGHKKIYLKTLYRVIVLNDTFICLLWYKQVLKKLKAAFLVENIKQNEKKKNFKFEGGLNRLKPAPKNLV